MVEKFGVPKGIRTPVTSVKGRCPGPLDDGDKLLSWGGIDELVVRSKEVDEIIKEKKVFRRIWLVSVE